MARGLYSALGWWPEPELDAAYAALSTFARAMNEQTSDAALAASLPNASCRAAALLARDAIRAFEARVGQSCGLDVGFVTTPAGRAIELGNRGHRAFGAAYEEAAAVVARALEAVLLAFGAERASGFTMD